MATLSRAVHTGVWELQGTLSRDDGTFVLFDAMRFVAAFAVVVQHSRNLFLLDYDQIVPGTLVKAFYFVTRFGHEAVIVFFVLSGFWISSAVDRRFNRDDFWTEYLVARLTRLLIVLVPTLLIGGLLDAIGLHVLHGALYEGRLGTEAFPESISANLRPEVLLGNMLFLQTILVPAFGTNGALWSLANEFWYYLWFPALFGLVRYHRFGWALASLVIAFVAPRLMALFPVWLLGAGVYFAHKRWSGRMEVPPRLANAVILLTSLALLATLAVSRIAILPELLADLLVGASFAGLLIGLLWRAPWVPRWISPFAAYGARSSFTLYACHYPLIAMLATLINGEARRAPTPGAVALTMAVAIVVIGCASLFSRLTEGRTGALRDWVRRNIRSRRLA